MRKLILAVPILLAGAQAMAWADTVPPGTEIAVRPDQPIHVSQFDRGRIFAAHIARDVTARDGDMAIPRGSECELIVRRTGENEMSLDLESITVNGRRYALDADGPQFHMNRDAYDNGGGLVGAIVGAVAGASGADVETHGNEIRVPEGAMLRFQLQQPLHVVNWSDPGYSNGPNHYHRDHDWYR